MNGRRRRLGAIAKIHARYWCLIEVRQVWSQIERRELGWWIACAAIVRYFAATEDWWKGEERDAFHAWIENWGIHREQWDWFLQLRHLIAHNDGPSGKAVPRVAWELPVDSSVWVGSDIGCPMLVIPPEKEFEASATHFMRNLVQVARFRLSEEQCNVFSRIVRATIAFVEQKMEPHAKKMREEEEDALRVISEQWLRGGKQGS